MISCATCGNAAFVDITAAPGGGRPTAPHWRARCTECGQEWDFTDPE